jgi:hydrogenase-4 component B
LQDPGSPLAAILYLAANITWIAGVLIALPPRTGAGHKFFASLLAIGALFLIASLVLAWPNGFDRVAPPPIFLGMAPVEIKVDVLTTPFLLILALLAFAVALFSPGYLHHLKDRVNTRLYWCCTTLFVFSMAQVITSANGLTFLVFWEMMSLSSVALVTAEPVRHRAQRAALIYLGATRIATALIAGSFIWLSSANHSWRFADWDMGVHSYAPAFLLFLGLCIKAGIWPFHIWLPYAHPEAPAPVSALMSGVMVKVAIYAMLRFFLFLPTYSPALAYTAIALGVISGVWGILFALVEHDLKRLLAYSTVENVGLILSGIGLAMLGRLSGQIYLTELALAGALLHCVNHGCFKGLLFLGAGSVDASAHTRDLGFLGGLAKKMPWTMALFFIGSASIAALPPFNGFASKWLLYQSFLTLSFSSDQILQRSMGLIVIGIFSLIGALSLACFTKAFGIAFLGRSRSDQAEKARECSEGMKHAQVLLAASCLTLAFLAPVTVVWLQPVLRLLLGPIYTAGPIFSIPMPTLFLLGCATSLLIFSLFHFLRTSVRNYNTWDCGYGPLPARAEETGTSFSHPIGRIFGPLLQYRTITQIEGRDRRHFPERINVEVYMFPALEAILYKPSIAAMQKLSGALVKMQTASIHIHLLYVFVAMLVLVCVGIYL